MEMKPVKSSNVESVGFENGTLRVQFKSGRAYDYRGVNASLYDDILAADVDPDRSVGKLIHGNVVKGGFDYRQVKERD